MGEERAQEPTVSLRIEALKTFTRSFASQSCQQLRTNAKVMAKGLSEALAQEFIVKTPSTRIRGIELHAHSRKPSVRKKVHVRLRNLF